MALRPVMTKPFGDEAFRFAYVNSWETVPPKLVDKEIGLLILESVTLLHALGSRRLGFWIGFALFGLVLEVIGFVTGTHYHAQFLFQVAHFLPLKELLYYPLTMYPSWLAVEKLRLPKVWQCAVTMGVIQQFANLPYDSFCARPGFGWTYMDPSFAFANFDRSAWHGGVAAIFYGWIGFGVASGAACALARNEKASAVNTIFMIEISSSVACALWTPYHWMKLIGCSKLWNFNAFLADPVQAYGQCVRESLMRDDMCWGVTLAALLVVFGLALRGAGHRQHSGGGMSDWLMVVVMCLYYVGVVVTYAQFDHDPASIVPVWAVHGFVACAVHIACHAHGSRQVAKSGSVHSMSKSREGIKPWSWTFQKPAKEKKLVKTEKDSAKPEKEEAPPRVKKESAKPDNDEQPVNAEKERAKPNKDKKPGKADKGKKGSKAKKND